MISNFSFDGSVGIRLDNKHYDLHSFFSVSRVILDPSEGTVAIEFSSFEEFREQVHGARTLRLTFSGVDHVEVSPGLCKSRSDTVDEFGFKDPNDRDDEWLKPTDRAERYDHLFVRFSSLEFVRLACSVARADVEK